LIKYSYLDSGHQYKEEQWSSCNGWTH